MSKKERGVAIMLVLFIVVLTTALVTSLARSTYLGGRVNSSIEKGLRAEYWAKSMLSVAQILIQADKNAAVDDPSDPWKLFQGELFKPEMLGIDEPNIKIDMEISPLGKRFPLERLNTSDPIQLSRWAIGLVKLFKSPALDFDNDGEVDAAGAYQGKHFSSEDLVANYIDYIDSDTSPTNIKDPNGNNITGTESSSTKTTFANRRLRKDEELLSIPGFTPARVQKMLPYVTTDKDVQFININAAPQEVYGALLDTIEPGISAIIEKKKQDNLAAFTSFQSANDVMNLFTADTKDVPNIINTGSNLFTVIAKVDTLTNITYLKATLRTSSGGGMPEIKSMQIY